MRWQAIPCGLIPPASLRGLSFRALLLAPGGFGVPAPAGALVVFMPDDGPPEQVAVPAGCVVPFERGAGMLRAWAAWDSSGAVAVASVQVLAE